jgi:hypothetical protein
MEQFEKRFDQAEVLPLVKHLAGRRLLMVPATLYIL